MRSKRFLILRLLTLASLMLLARFAVAGPRQPLASALTRRDGKSLYVQVKVNHAGPFWFNVDSGAHHTIIDPLVAQQARLRIIGSSTTTGTGQGEVPYQHVGPITMNVNGLKLDIADPWVIDLSSTGNPEWMHGLLGAQFFEAYVIEIDPEKPALRFFDAKTYQPPKDAAKIPLIVENDRFFVMAKLEVNDRLTVEHKLRVDTGSEDAVDDEVVKNGMEVRASILGHGLGQNYQGQSGVFKAVRLGPFTFQQVWGPAITHPAIGMEMFRRFTCIFDAPHRALYLLPNRHLSEPVPAPGG